MATTRSFEETLVTPEDPKVKIEIEFGRSSFFGGENRMYFIVDGKHVIISPEQGQRLYDAMGRLGAYLCYDEDQK